MQTFTVTAKSARKPASGGARSCLLSALLVIFSIFSLGTGFWIGREYEQFLSIQRAVHMTLAAGADAIRPSSSSARGTSKGGMPISSVPGSEGKLQLAAICANTCKKAKDGVCDDGRVNLTHTEKPQVYARVYCDLGTDCADCGPWTPSGPVSWLSGQSAQGPISLLLDKGADIRLKRTHEMPVPFIFAYTDPVNDRGSAGVENSGLIEHSMSKIFYHIFKGRCVKPNGDRSLFVDVGSNFGWFSILAGTMGCKAMAFEPVPHFRAFLEYNVHINNLASLIDIRTHVVSHESGKEMQMVVPDKGLWGTAGIDGLNIDSSIKSNIEKIMIKSHRLDDVVKQDVILMKIDVEGWEWSVIQGSMKLLQQYKVENIVMEYSPGVQERSYAADKLRANVKMLVDLVGVGYRIAYADGPIFGAFHDLPPAMEEATMDNLKYDVEDVERFIAKSLNCPLPQELDKYWLASCNVIPEDLNPRSLHSVVGHNTNLWLSKNQTLQRLKGIVGVLKPSDPATKFFTSEVSGNGQGARICKDIEPKVQVRHRCRCTNKAVCGEEEKIAALKAEEGKIVSNYIIP